MDVLRGLLGMATLVAVAWLFSTQRRSIAWRVVLWGLALQVSLAVLVLQVPLVKQGFEWVSGVFVKVLEFTNAGTGFVFGKVLNIQPGNQPIVAFQILPVIVFFSALTAALFHLGVLQRIVKGLAWAMQRSMRLSGPECLSAAGNVFLGQTEAPLLVKPYLAGMSRSELMAVMTGGMATVAGSVMAAYIGMLGGADPAQQQLFATHLLTASVINAPAALLMAKLLVPEDPRRQLERGLALQRDPSEPKGLIEAIANGTTDGLKLALNVAGMLIVFLALIALLNSILGGVGDLTGLNAWVAESTGGRYTDFSLQYLFGLIFRPIAWLIGIDWQDTLVVGSLLGTKTVANEFLAYQQLSSLPTGALAEKSRIISAYALCGFANFASIGIQIGGIGSMAPARRSEIARLGLLALLGGTLASLLSASVAGMLL